MSFEINASSKIGLKVANLYESSKKERDRARIYLNPLEKNESLSDSSRKEQELILIL